MDIKNLEKILKKEKLCEKYYDENENLKYIITKKIYGIEYSLYTIKEDQAILNETLEDPTQFSVGLNLQKKWNKKRKKNGG